MAKQLVKNRPGRGKCQGCQEVKPRYEFGNCKGEYNLCKPCRAKNRAENRKPNSAYGATVIQTNEEIAKAWETAMGNNRFTSLVYR